MADAYRFERELGGGGMSRVFLAEELQLGRKVVVKVLPPELGAGLNIDRFRREIQLAASLQHPHIVPLLAAGSADGLLYYTMPMVEGESLRAKISREGGLPIGEAVRLLRDVADALACAHEHNIVHRDIKPDNVLVSRHHGLVTDFGVAKALSEATGPSSLTSTGLALGTPAYMAPEQASADPHTDHRADLYALGALGYEMLTGRPPFTGPSPQAVLAAQVTRAPEPVTQNRAAVPPGLAALIMRCLEKHPADRWQSAEEVLGQLEAMATPSGGTSPTQAVMAPWLGGRGTEGVRILPVLGVYCAAALGVLGVTWGLTLQLGLPGWVFPGAIALLIIGLPIILTTAVIQRRRALAQGATSSLPVPAGAHHLFTWRRAIGGGVAAFAVLGLVTAAYMTMRALGIGPVGSLVASGVLKERERIIVSEFANHTGDNRLSEAVTQAFQVDFAQSPMVTAVPPDYVHQVLKRMSKPDSIPLDLALAREVAVREGIKAVIAGDISAAGPRLVLSASLVSAETGDVLAAYRETADDSTAIIGAVDRLSKSLRERIGESLRSIRANPPLDRVTTSSLDALRKYSQAIKAFDEGDDGTRTIALLEEAVALDSGFAMAYRKLGIVLGNLGEQRARRIEVLTKAFQHRDRLTERERYLTLGTYYWGVTGEEEKAMTAYQSVLDTYPDDFTALTNLGLLYQSAEDYPRAATLFHRALAQDSSSPINYDNLSDLQLAMGQRDSAAATIKRLADKAPGNWMVELKSAALASSGGDYAAAEAHLKTLRESQKASLGWRATPSGELATVAQVQGRIAEADRYLLDAMAANQARGQPSNALSGAAGRAEMTAVLKGAPEEGARMLDAALVQFPLASMAASDRPYLDLAGSYVSAGRPDRARSLVMEFERAVPAELRGGNADLYRHGVLGYIALAERKPDQTISELQEINDGSCPICAFVVLGKAYDLAGQADSAIAVYQRFVDTPWMWRVHFDGLWLPPTLHRLAELYEEKGDREKAALYYSRFVDLWKNADPALQPRVSEARHRLAKLTSQ
ncbi:MAG: protein kinase domain-containing protein [Gemmatimonadales bacterium]